MQEQHRCEWCKSDSLYISYHDEEWGVPEYDDQNLFEMINLEGAQAGLSWITILKKRENYRQAFDHFDPNKVVKYTAARQKKLLANPGIVRNKLKVAAVISNARAFLDIKDKGQSFSDYIWQFTDGKVIQNNFKKMSDIPAKTELSDKLSKQLKRDGFKFVGGTIAYAFMQAVGMVNDHSTDCFRHKELS